MSGSKFLAFDFGAESGRTIIGMINDGGISLQEIHRFPNKQVEIGGHLHWDFQYLFGQLKHGLRLSIEKGHSDIRSIGVDTWGVDFGLIGKDGILLEDPYAYRDSRTDGMMDRVFEKITREKIYSITGIQTMQINTLFQLYSANVKQGELLKESDALLFMPDLFNYFLTGKKCSEYTIASTSQLLDASKKNWDETLFRTLGLPIRIMQPIVQPGTIVGKLLPEIAEEAGLKETVDVVAVGCHDTASAVAAVPSQSENWGFISSGTWSLIGIESDRPYLSKDALRNDFTNEGGVDNKIRFLRNVTGLWLLQECRRSWEKQGDRLDYIELSKLAGEAQTLKCRIDPDDPFFLHPPDMPEAIQEYCERTNQPVPDAKGEFVRCILESLAFKYRNVVDRIKTITGKRIERLHIVGGGSQNDLLNQLTSNACGIPVAANPVEATALGNIIVQALAKNILPSLQKARELVAHSFPVKWYEPVRCHVSRS
jgi:rhamnulokinase